MRRAFRQARSAAGGGSSASTGPRRARPRGGRPAAAGLLALTLVGAGVARAGPESGLGPARRSVPADAALATVAAPPLWIHHPEGYGVMARDLAHRGPLEAERIAAALGLPVPRRLDVYLLPPQAAVDPRDWGLPLGPRWAAGLALSGRAVVVLRTSENVGPYGNELARVLTHELVHAVASEGLGPRYREMPAWMREGTASYLSFDWRLVDSARSARHALAGDLIPLRDIDESFPSDAEQAQRAYLQSFAFVAWLVDRSPPQALARLHVGVASGERFESAFRDAFGDLPSALVQEFRGRFLLVHRWIPLVTSTTTLWLLVAGLILVAGVRRRRRVQRTLEQWEEDEEAAALRVRAVELGEADEHGPFDEGSEPSSVEESEADAVPATPARPGATSADPSSREDR